MKVLIADDDPIPRRILQSTLKKWEYDVVVAEDGEEAWKILQQDDAPKIAILDWLMPGLDGLEICRKVRQKANSPYIYLILLTSKDQKEDIVEGMEAGADDYLIKPFETPRLHVRLRAGRRIIDLQTALLESLSELERARHREVEIGARIQKTLLLGQPPAYLPGIEVAALSIPSQQIDGDFYDFFKHNNRCVDVIVGDVMGKGVPAALFGAAIKSHFLRAMSHLLSAADPGCLPEPEAIVTEVHNEVTSEFIGLDSFMTLCYARFDQEQQRIVFVDCGHTKTIHISGANGEMKTLQGDSMPLGISERETYEQVTAEFGAGDLFFFYSDGVTEARNEAGELYGFDRLAETIQTYRMASPEALIAHVRRAVIEFAHSETFPDDLTCVAVRIGETKLLPAEAGEAGSAGAQAKKENQVGWARLEVSSALTELATIRAFLRGFCRDVAPPMMDEDRLSALELAVNEAASNIMRHAYQGQADRQIQVEAEADAGRIIIRLYNTGTPFDPSMAKPPSFDGSREGGFGVYMIAECVDEVKYFRDEQGRNGISLVKNRN